MKKITILILILFSSGCVFSQSVSDILHIRMTAIECFQDYIQKFSSLDYPSKDNRYEFQKFFHKNAIIYNDLLPNNMPILISPDEYVQRRNKDISLNPNFSNLSLGFPYEENGLWKIELSYLESITIKNLYTGIEYPKCTFHCTMTISMERNKAYNKGATDNFSEVSDVTHRMAFINPIICHIEVNDPIKQFILIRKNESLTSIPCSFSTIPNAEENPFFIMIDADTTTLKTCTDTSEEFFLIRRFVSSDKDTKIYDYKIFKKNLLGLGLSYAPYGLGNTLNKSQLPDFKIFNQSLGFDIFYGLNLVSKKKSALFFNIKLGINAYLNNFKGNWHTQYNATDMDGESYLRKIRVSNTLEKAYHLSASLHPSFEYAIQIYSHNQQKIFLSLEAGGYLEYRFWASNSFQSNATYSGIYNYFEGIEFTHYYDFGSFVLNNKNISQNIRNKLNLFDYGVFGAIGVWYAFNSNHLIKANIGYTHGFTSPFKSVENHILSSDLHTYQSAVHTIENGIRNIYLNVSYIKTLTK